METTTASQSLFNILSPSEISMHFEVKQVKEYSDRIELRMEELSELVSKIVCH